MTATASVLDRRSAIGARPMIPPLPRIVRWQPYVNPARTMLGFLSAAMPSGMIVNNMKLMVGAKGKPWLAMPSIKRLDRDGNPVLDDRGKPIWDDVVEFADSDARARFQEQVLAALRASHPEAFAGELRCERPLHRQRNSRVQGETGRGGGNPQLYLGDKAMSDIALYHRIASLFIRL
jgi:hypothetical protein